MKDNYLTLHNGMKLPSLGMGTFPLSGKAMDTAVDAALSCGYRLFDTAYAYQNDDSLGSSLMKYLPKHGLNRSDIYITTKLGDACNKGRPLGIYFYNSESCISRDIKTIVKEQIDSALKNLKTDYIDVLLIHYPYPDYFMEIWSYMEDAYKAGKARAIGVSNFRERHLNALLGVCGIKPMVNQFEHHPLNTEKDLTVFCKGTGIQVEAYSPLLVMNKRLMSSGILNGLSQKYSKSIPQIILRWNTQLGIIPIPKSGNPERLKENIGIFDFSLSEADIENINSLNENFKSIPESMYCPGY